jgi:hypothetical protein
VVADAGGDWYLIQWAASANFTVYHVDKELNLTELGKFAGNGFHSVDILDARFIAKDVLHFFWGDVVSDGNHLRMRCVDFDVKQKKWLHAREIYRLDQFVGSANEPTVFQLPDDSLHYLWRIDEGARHTEATGLYYQAEADGKTVKVAPGYEYRAVALGDRLLVCYTVEESPNKVFFRVIHHGAPGPVSEITVAKGRKYNLRSEDLLLHADKERLWFMNTVNTAALYELKIDEETKP